MTILTATAWKSNAELIEAVHELGYIRDTDTVLDPTYGYGTFWKNYCPPLLIGSDLDPDKSPTDSIDFTNLPWPDASFDVAVFDGPYKLNGTPDPAEERYGVHEATRWQDRMRLLRLGTAECARVVKPKGYLLVKCQDQVCSGAKRWQTDVLTEVAIKAGFVKRDRFDLLGDPRPQPRDDQKHTHTNYSTLLVFRKKAR